MSDERAQEQDDGGYGFPWEPIAWTLFCFASITSLFYFDWTRENFLHLPPKG